MEQNTVGLLIAALISTTYTVVTHASCFYANCVQVIKSVLSAALFVECIGNMKRGRL